MPIPRLLEAVIAHPAIRVDEAPGRDRLPDEPLQTSSRRIGDLAHPDAPQPAPADLLNCHGNQHLIQLAPAPRAGLSCAPVGLVHLDAARQPVPAWPDHGAAELVQPRPRRLVASQTQGSLQPQGAHPTLLVGDPPHRPKPRRQWRPRVLEDRPRRHRGLVGAVRALPPPFPDAPGLRPITARAPKSLRPPELLQIRLTRLLGRESALEFGHISGILLHRLVRYILGLPESSKYLVQLILPPARTGRPYGPIRCRHRLGGMLKY